MPYQLSFTASWTQSNVQVLAQFGIATFPFSPDPDEYVRKNVATLIREIAKHTPEVRPHTVHMS